MSKIKEHFHRNKKIYIGIAIGVGVSGLAVITYAIMRGDFSGKDRIIGHTDSGKDRIIGHTDSHFFADAYSSIDASINKTVMVMEREGRGHTGYLVKHLESGLVYRSQREAAEALNISKDALSNHLNGRSEHVLGNHFERLTMASVEEIVA